MNPDTGQLYQDVDAEAALRRGEELIELTRQEFEQVRDMTPAERIAWASERGKERKRARVPSPHAHARRRNRRVQANRSRARNRR